jgi:DNA-binding transcriptional MerR regulator
MEDLYELTGTEIARQSGLTTETVRTYARGGLLEFRQLSNGIRVFRRSAVAQAKKIYAANIARRYQTKASATA